MGFWRPLVNSAAVIGGGQQLGHRLDPGVEVRKPVLGGGVASRDPCEMIFCPVPEGGSQGQSTNTSLSGAGTFFLCLRPDYGIWEGTHFATS